MDVRKSKHQVEGSRVEVQSACRQKEEAKEAAWLVQTHLGCVPRDLSLTHVTSSTQTPS